MVRLPLPIYKTSVNVPTPREIRALRRPQKGGMDLPMSLKYLAVILLLGWSSAVTAQESGRYIDDEKYSAAFEAALTMAAAETKGTPGLALRPQLKRGAHHLTLKKAAEKATKPQAIHKAAGEAVFAIGSVRHAADGKSWEATDPATAWVASSDGLLVTNWHVFEDCRDEELFGVMSRTGIYFPVMEVVAADEASDIAVLRIEASGLKPLLLGEEAEEGSRIFVLSHPDRQFFTFTQGHVSRYTLQHSHEKDAGTRYMCITADYAKGSSGGPVLNGSGAVVGMVCSTQTTYYGRRGKDKDDDVQMVVKFCVPGESIRKLLTSGPKPAAPVLPPPAAPAEVPAPPTPTAPPAE